MRTGFFNLYRSIYLYSIKYTTMKLGLFTLPLFFTLIFLSNCTSESQVDEDVEVWVHVPPVLPDSVYAKLQEGDLIMRKGNGPLSFHIMNATKEDYSHCGIIVKEADKWRVIHSMGGSVSNNDQDGVQIMDLDEFVRHATDSMLFICRATFQDSIGFKIREGAYKFLEEATPFDHSFNLFTRDEIYCSELFFHVLRDATGKNQFLIRKQHKSYILLFETFFNEEKYQPIFHLKDLGN